MKKKVLLTAIAVLLSILSALAQDEYNWKVENDTLFLSGQGDMPDYPFPINEYHWPSPWHDYEFSAVVIAHGVTSIGSFAFFYCRQFASINIANSVTKIKDYAFTESNPDSVVLPNSVTFIDEAAFLACGFVSVTLPNSVTFIGSRAFSSCDNLTSITNHNPVPLAIDSTVFRNVNVSACTLYVPEQSVRLYKQASVWQDFIIRPLVGIEEFDADGELLIYPNPAAGNCKIVIPQELLHENSLTLSVYDAFGKLLQQEAIDSSTEETGLKLDFKAQGVYVAVLSNGKKRYTGKVVFE